MGRRFRNLNIVKYLLVLSRKDKKDFRHLFLANESRVVLHFCEIATDKLRFLLCKLATPEFSFFRKKDFILFFFFLFVKFFRVKSPPKFFPKKMKGKVVLLLGSKADATHALKITEKLKNLQIPHETNIMSAHKNTREVLILLENLATEKNVILVTIAGRSNALSGVCAANSAHPVIACPPFTDKVDLILNIQSSLQMPSQTPVLTIIDPENCALACERILQTKAF